MDATPANDGKFATWNEHIKPYAEKVIAAIRAIDPDNLIANPRQDFPLLPCIGHGACAHRRYQSQTEGSSNQLH